MTDAQKKAYISSEEVEDDNFDLTAALEKAAFVKRGDIWHVGRHTLMCGDAISSDDVDVLMGTYAVLHRRILTGFSGML